MTDSPEEEAALDADAKAYRADEQREAVARALWSYMTLDIVEWGAIPENDTRKVRIRGAADAAIAALAAAQQEPAAFEWKPAAPKLLRPTAAQQEPKP